MKDTSVNVLNTEIPELEQDLSPEAAWAPPAAPLEMPRQVLEAVDEPGRARVRLLPAFMLRGSRSRA